MQTAYPHRQLYQRVGWMEKSPVLIPFLRSMKCLKSEIPWIEPLKKEINAIQ